VKATDLEEGMTVRQGKRLGKVIAIKTRIYFQVQPEIGVPIGYYMDGDAEVEVVENQESLL
jgi:hypothetical protein